MSAFRALSAGTGLAAYGPLVAMNLMKFSVSLQGP